MADRGAVDGGRQDGGAAKRQGISGMKKAAAIYAAALF